ncbi:MAG TPA: hypothetical protein DD665_10500 [Alphaproteobacteria bacterium]|nr:hypothetical protein [Alphaproteobacteria bacterium]
MKTLTLAIVSAALLMPVSAMASQTTVKTVIGKVETVEVLTNTYIRKTPTEENVCQTEEVPVYSEKKGGKELDGLIIGGLLGSAVGNAVSKGDGAGTIGAVTGALIGREHVKKNKRGGEIVGYRQQEVCNIRTVMTEQTVEEITGYRVRIEVDGKIISLESKRPRNLGERVEINRKTTYSLR